MAVAHSGVIDPVLQNPLSMFSDLLRDDEGTSGPFQSISTRSDRKPGWIMGLIGLG